MYIRSVPAAFCVLIYPHSLFQSIGISYLSSHPDGQVRVHAEEPKPILRLRPNLQSGFRRYSFVDSVLALDPIGKMEMTAADFKVRFFLFLECRIVFLC